MVNIVHLQIKILQCTGIKKYTCMYLTNTIHRLFKYILCYLSPTTDSFSILLISALEVFLILKIILKKIILINNHKFKTQPSNITYIGPLTLKKGSNVLLQVSDH